MAALPPIMIQLTRLSGETFILNAFMVKQIQSYPDTTITLTNGKKIVVQTPELEVLELVTTYHRNVSIQGSLYGLSENA